MIEIIAGTVSLKDSGGDNYYTKLTSADIGADKNFTLTSPVLQIVSTTLRGSTTTYSVAATSNGASPATAVAGFTVAITPKSSSSKIFIMGVLFCGLGTDNEVRLALTKGGSIISEAVGTAAGNRSPETASWI